MECLTDLTSIACSSRVNFQEPTFYFTITQLFTVTGVGLPIYPIPTAMWDRKSWNTWCSRLWSPPKLNVSLFVIWTSLLCKSSSMLRVLRWMWVQNVLVHGIILEMLLRGDSICTVESRRLVALASDVSYVIKFFANHQNMGPAVWGNTRWQKLRSQCETNWQSWKSLNWLVQQSMKQHWTSWRDKEVEEL